MERKRGTESKKPRGGATGDGKAAEISPFEWDFRLVRVEELFTVILYEYTRSCPRVLGIIKNWHGQKVNYRELLRLDCPRETKPLLKALKKIKGATNAHAVEIAYDPATTGTDANAKSLLLTHLWFMGPQDEASLLGQSIATTFGSLDHPWEHLRATRGSHHFTRRLFNFSPRTAIMDDLGSQDTWQHIVMEQPGVKAEHLLVDWSLPRKQLVEAFRCWVQDRHPGIPPEGRRPPGRKPRWEFLKWLAAYRLHENGYNHNEAQELVRSRLRMATVDDAPDVLPVYEDAPAWGKAVARARAELSGDFTGSVKTSFDS